MALSRVVSEILNVEKCCDLEIAVEGHSTIDCVWFPISVL